MRATRLSILVTIPQHQIFMPPSSPMMLPARVYSIGCGRHRNLLEPRWRTIGSFMELQFTAESVNGGYGDAVGQHLGKCLFVHGSVLVALRHPTLARFADVPQRLAAQPGPLVFHARTGAKLS